jgi:L-alanine-DL-glutamate epimerase-like enolase superfamily enzyme
MHKAPSIGVLQPDVCMLGGLSEAKRALAMLAAAKKTPAPHTPFVGPAALASLHMLAVTEARASSPPSRPTIRWTRTASA